MIQVFISYSHAWALQKDEKLKNSLRQILLGKGGEDVLRGGPGADHLVGGPDRDSLNGQEGGGDVLDAADNFADAGINCGPGAGEVANVDALDPAPVNC